MDVSDEIKECLELAKQLEERGEFESTLPLYEKAEASDAASWIPHSRHLRTLRRIGRIAEAEDLVGDYLRRNPDAPGAALNDFGVIKAELGRFPDAIKCFFRALRSATPPTPSLLLGNLAYVLFCENRTSECAKVCDRILRLDPDELRAHYILSLIESMSSPDARLCPGANVVRDGARAEAVALLALDGQAPAKLRGRMEKEGSVVRLDEAAAHTGAGRHWGVLLRSGEDTWCGLSERPGGGQAEAPLLLPMPAAFHVVQRRRWVRVLATGGIAELRVRSFPTGAERFDVESIVELNLSGGGAAVRTVPQLPRGAVVDLVLKLDGAEELEVSARVTRICRPLAAEPYSGLAFVNVSETDRERVARFVHHVQLDRKRGTAPVAGA